jgi:peptidoglycan lytic transglycosylase
MWRVDTMGTTALIGHVAAHGAQPGVPPGPVASRRVTPLADLYTGRHIRQARHGAWLNKKRSRSRPNRQLLPAAAALTVIGLLVGGTGTAMQLNPPGPSDAADLPASFDPPSNRAAQLNRASRGESRSTPTKAAAGADSVASTGSCDASYYAVGQRTASGEAFDPDALTAAHRTLPFDTRVRVINLATGMSITVRINDRGPYLAGRCLDLSRAAFDAIANLSSGVIDVRYEVLIEDAT